MRSLHCIPVELQCLPAPVACRVSFIPQPLSSYVLLGFLESQPVLVYPDIQPNTYETPVQISRVSPLHSTLSRPRLGPLFLHTASAPPALGRRLSSPWSGEHPFQSRSVWEHESDPLSNQRCEFLLLAFQIVVLHHLCHLLVWSLKNMSFLYINNTVLLYLRASDLN